MTKEEKEKIRDLIESGKIYEESRYKKWRNSIFKRDGHSCQFPDCKWPMGKLNAHHIHMKWYKPEWIYKLLNGITLCEYHHRYIHKKGSEDYIDLFENIAIRNTEKPRKSLRKVKKLNKKTVKRQLKNMKGKKKKVLRIRRLL